MKFLFRGFFVAAFVPLIWLIYRIRRTGTGFVPREGGALLLSNHVSYVDAFIMYYSCPRRVRFVVLEEYMKVKSIAWFLRLFDAIPIRPARPREALMRTVDALREGDVVCLFPEGGLTRLGVPVEFKKGFELIARKAEAPVIPVYMDGLWNSIFSFERGKYFRKRPNGWKCPIQVAFGRPIPPEETNLTRVREAVMEQSVEAFSLRREFDEPLEKALIRNLKRGKRRSLFTEYGKKRPRDWARSQTLGMAVAVARRWMNSPPDDSDRIGILLPPGPMTAVLNYGLFLAGKTPINLPFTLDQEGTEKVANTIAPLEVRTVITSRAFMPHLMDFWEGDEGVFIDLKSMTSNSGVSLLERARAFCEPTWLTAWRLDLGRRPHGREAVGLIAEPGDEPILLSAEQLHRNAVQVTAANFLQKDDTVFVEESLATPAGLQLGCWSPALSRGRVVSRSLSLRDSFEELERAILEEGVNVVAGSPEWFGGVNSPLSIRSLDYGLVLGEVSHWRVREWEETLDLPLARGWSRAGRLVTMSRPNPDTEEVAHHAPQRARHPRSIGRLLPGIASKIEEERLYLRFDPVEREGADDKGDGNWIEGPDDVVEESDRMLFLPDPDPR